MESRYKGTLYGATAGRNNGFSKMSGDLIETYCIVKGLDRVNVKDEE